MYGLVRRFSALTTIYMYMFISNHKYYIEPIAPRVSIFVSLYFVCKHWPFSMFGFSFVSHCFFLFCIQFKFRFVWCRFRQKHPSAYTLRIVSVNINARWFWLLSKNRQPNYECTNNAKKRCAYFQSQIRIECTNQNKNPKMTHYIGASPIQEIEKNRTKQAATTTTTGR